MASADAIAKLRERAMGRILSALPHLVLPQHVHDPALLFAKQLEAIAHALENVEPQTGIPANYRYASELAERGASKAEIIAALKGGNDESD